jgi:hypothetical protein
VCSTLRDNVGTVQPGLETVNQWVAIRQAQICLTFAHLARERAVLRSNSAFLRSASNWAPQFIGNNLRGDPVEVCVFIVVGHMWRWSLPSPASQRAS